jgi:hypothetical protein
MSKKKSSEKKNYGDWLDGIDKLIKAKAKIKDNETLFFGRSTENEFTEFVHERINANDRVIINKLHKIGYEFKDSHIQQAAFLRFDPTGGVDVNILKAVLHGKSDKEIRHWKDTNGHNLLHFARTPEAIDFLLEQGLKLNDKKPPNSAHDILHTLLHGGVNNRDNSFSLMTGSYKSPRTDYIDCVKYLVDRGISTEGASKYMLPYINIFGPQANKGSVERGIEDATEELFGKFAKVYKDAQKEGWNNKKIISELSSKTYDLLKEILPHGYESDYGKISDFSKNIVKTLTDERSTFQKIYDFISHNVFGAKSYQEKTIEKYQGLVKDKIKTEIYEQKSSEIIDKIEHHADKKELAKLVRECKKLHIEHGVAGIIEDQIKNHKLKKPLEKDLESVVKDLQKAGKDSESSSKHSGHRSPHSSKPNHR